MRETTRDFPRNRGYPWGRLSSVLRRDIQIERLQWLRTSRFDLVVIEANETHEIEATGSEPLKTLNLYVSPEY